MCRLLGEAVVAGEAVGDGAAPCEPGVDEVDEVDEVDGVDEVDEVGEVGAGDAIGE